ncbi:MAG: 3-hydroxyacyl-[acyl-carrier-protein] dehydratase FabZ [Verrucomicrobia bacterium]|nr:MAG: 3-hydroxyacyl-[acyl-carrier-protein] dehydratase FabZ [Verrucomicrobiota bacterium]
MRYFLLDKITVFEPGKRAAGIKCVTLTDEVLHDHFPDYPLLPGALLIESMSQLGGFLVELSFHNGGPIIRRAVLAQIKDAKFHRACKPGDRIELESVLESQSEGAARVNVIATVDGEQVARAELVFVLRPVDSPRVHEQRRNVYRIWTQDLNPPPLIP